MKYFEAALRQAQDERQDSVCGEPVEPRNRWVIPTPPKPLRFVLGEGIRQALRAQDAWEGRRGSGATAA